VNRAGDRTGTPFSAPISWLVLEQPKTIKQAIGIASS
jgi:hypothetical protein